MFLKKCLFLVVMMVLLKMNTSVSALNRNVNQFEVSADTPTVLVNNKEYILGIFFQANWYRASQFCRFHGMDLASFSSEAEYIQVLNLINTFGLNRKRFWTSGTDLATQSEFFWMSNGQPLTYTSWYAGEPNNIGAERCIEIWNGNVTSNPLKWNNSLCFEDKNFVCERYL